MSNIKFNKGVALYLTIVVLAIMSACFFALTTILVSQIKITSNLSDSVLAFTAADTGIEEALYRIRYSGNSDNFSFLWQADYFYDVNISVDVDEEKITAVSKGSYRDSRRAIEISF